MSTRGVTRTEVSRRITPQWLDGLAVLVLLVALAAWLWPLATTVTPREMRVPDVPRPAVTDSAAVLAIAGRDDDAEQRIIANNLFSVSRRAPRSRFVLPGQEPPEALAPTDADVALADAAGPQLFGIMVLDGVRQALLQVSAADSVPRVVRVGDRVGPYVVRSITQDRVVLSSSSGPRIVRLARRESSDSLGKQP